MQLQWPKSEQTAFDANALFSGITKENTAQKIEQLKTNATFENLNKVVAAMHGFKPSNEAEKRFKISVLEFTLSYRIGQTARNDVGLTADEVLKKYGAYKHGKNDCYTYVMKVADSALGDLKEDKRFQLLDDAGKPFIRRYTLEEFNKLPTKPALYTIETKHRKGDSFDFNPGDHIRVDKSPIGRGLREHHGILAIGEGGAAEVIIQRAGRKITRMDLNKFLQNTENFQIRRLFGGKEYQEHFHAQPHFKEAEIPGKTSIKYTVEKKAGSWQQAMLAPEPLAEPARAVA